MAKDSLLHMMHRMQGDMVRMAAALRRRQEDLEALHNEVVSNAPPLQLASYAKALKMGWGINDYYAGLVKVQSKKRIMVIAEDGSFEKREMRK